MHDISQCSQVIRVLVVFGVGAIIGDGVLTPAISVISSIEGLHQVATISQGAAGLTHVLSCKPASCPFPLSHKDVIVT